MESFAFFKGSIASCIGLIIFTNDLPKAVSRILFLVSDIFCIILLKKSETPVHNALASSKSPMIISHDCVQPD